MDVESLTPTARQVIISKNPHSGSTDQSALIQQLCDCLSALNFQPIVLTEVADIKRQVDLGIAQNELRAVVAAGGDGTVSLLANELPAATPLAIFPLGTENLLSKYLQQKADPRALAETIDRGLTVRLDAGRANGKLFLVMASCGFDADVVTRLHARRSGHINHWSYAGPIVGSIRRYPYPDLRMCVDNESQPLAGRWAFIFNVPRYALNLPIINDADPCDGRLDMCSFPRGSLVLGFYYLFSIVLGRHRRWKKSPLCRFKRMRIETKCATDSVPYQLDGDPGGVLPVEIEVQPKFLRVIVSETWINRNDRPAGDSVLCP